MVAQSVTSLLQLNVEKEPCYNSFPLFSTNMSRKGLSYPGVCALKSFLPLYMTFNY